MTNQPVIVPRPQATDWLLRWKDRDVIKVVTGLRRCGKSTALKLAQRALVESGVNERSIVSVDLERLDFAAPTTPQEVYDYVVARISSPSCYVFIDEPSASRALSEQSTRCMRAKTATSTSPARTPICSRASLPRRLPAVMLSSDSCRSRSRSIVVPAPPLRTNADDTELLNRLSLAGEHAVRLPTARRGRVRVP